MILFLLSVIGCGAAGGWVGQRAGLPLVAGIVVGGLFNVLGVVFLAGVWGAEWVISQAERLR